MTYDVRRLRLHGLIRQIPHSNTYVTMTEGLRVALFYMKVHARLLRPLLDAGDRPPTSVEFRRALAPVDRVIAD